MKNKRVIKPYKIFVEFRMYVIRQNSYKINFVNYEISILSGAAVQSVGKKKDLFYRQSCFPQKSTKVN